MNTRKFNINRLFSYHKWEIISNGITPENWDDRWQITKEDACIVCKRTRMGNTVFNLFYHEVFNKEKNLLLFAVIDFAEIFIEYLSEDLHDECNFRLYLNRLLDEIIDPMDYLK